jgi:dipeptidyl aminopeptidase/acylaminoacyl peptidase
MEQDVYAFGHWPSPISAALVAGSALRFGRIQAVDRAVYWSEGRPAERGRTPVMRWAAEDGVTELLPPPYSARSRVHEYGGGEFLVAGSALYFVNDADQDVYAADLSRGAKPSIRRITTVADTRFADFAWDARRDRLIAVGETHGAPALPQNALWHIPAGEMAEGARLALQGRDFYASPRISPDGDRFAFLAWDLPAMPWDAAQLFVAGIAEDGSLSKPVPVAGGNGSACFQPEWSGDGALYFVWDTAGQGNLYRWREGGQAEQITRLEGDLSMPLWNFHAASYALFPGGKVYLSFVDRGETKSAILDLGTSASKPHENGLTTATTLSAGAAGVALAGLTDEEPLCVFLDESPAIQAPQIIRRSGTLDIDRAFVSRPTRIAIPNGRGEVFGLLYPPANPGAKGPAWKKPPLIISLHGGPTSAAARGLKPRTLFFTSRGFSWLDLDYSGSTGYGRPYRDRLKGNWGVADVEDTVSAARFAASEGLADDLAIFVTGGSAGGYTVLAAIASASVFRGAASYYGICDLVALQRTTHKFEQGYQSTLLGGSLDDHEALYRERSAIHHIEAINTPLILFQGVEDQVVPKEQSIRIAEALRLKGVPVEYHEFSGEGHGFRRADTIRACLERELGFYRMLMHEGS